MIVNGRDLHPASISFAITGLISVSSNTRSPITMASPCIGLNATQPPSANDGLMATPSSVTVRSVARKTVAVDVARYCRLSTERRVDLLPVDVLGAGSGYRRHDGAAE